MEFIINYFESIPSAHRSIIIVGGITLFWLFEGVLPLSRFQYKKWKHALPNFFFTLTTIIVNFSLAFILLRTADWVTANQFGLLNAVERAYSWVVLSLLVLRQNQNHFGYKR